MHSRIRFPQLFLPLFTAKYTTSLFFSPSLLSPSFSINHFAHSLVPSFLLASQSAWKVEVI